MLRNKEQGSIFYLSMKEKAKVIYLIWKTEKLKSFSSVNKNDCRINKLI